MTRANLIALSIALTAGACLEKEIPISFPTTEPRLDIEALFRPNEKALALIARTIDVNEPTVDFSVTDAVVTVWKNNQPVDTLAFIPPEIRRVRGPGYSGYESGRSFEIDYGAEYQLVVEAPGLPTARSEIVRPHRKISLHNVQYELHITDRYSSKISSLSFSIADDPGTDDLYRVQIEYRNTDLPWYVYNVGHTFELDDDNVTSDTIHFHQVDMQVFEISDYFPDIDFKRTFPNQAVIRVTRYDQAYEAFLESRLETNSEFGGLFAGNPFVASNIQNGYGVFSIAEVDSLPIISW